MSGQQYEQQLLEDISGFYDDPLGFVLYAFPWGEGSLSDFEGPDQWQYERLKRLGEKIREDPLGRVRMAIASGHGIGKTAWVSWLIIWLMSTRPHLTAVVTANTQTQLSTKTWRELALWHARSINKQWFEWTATKFAHIEHSKTWYVTAAPNTEKNSEAFAGLHGPHVAMIYDEASAIPDKIWEVSEGAMTTDRAMWFAFGNPTRNTGRFKSCFYEDRRRWDCVSVDSRTASMTNKEELNEWVETYGEDSDFIRVRVRGQFPRAGTLQYISSDLVDLAIQADIEYEAYAHMPLILSADVARFGDDKTVVGLRQGRKLLRLYKFRDLNTMQVATEISTIISEVRPDACFVDSVGVGAGVIDRLRQLGHDIIEVNPGTNAQKDELYYNKRAEMWARMKAWLLEGADIPDDRDMRNSLIGLEYGFDKKERIQLERKRDMKRRGLDSPDEGDCVAYGFAEIVVATRDQSFEPSSFEPKESESHESYV